MNKNNNNFDCIASRIMWQCRRCMLELDLLLIPFFTNKYSKLTEELKCLFLDFLNLPDPIMMQILIDDEPQIDDLERFNSLVKLIKTNNTSDN